MYLIPPPFQCIFNLRLRHYIICDCCEIKTVPNVIIRDFCKTDLVTVLSCKLFLTETISAFHLQDQYHKKAVRWFFLKIEGVGFMEKEVRQLQRCKKTREFCYSQFSSYSFAYLSFTYSLTVNYLCSFFLIHVNFLWINRLIIRFCELETVQLKIRA